MGIDEAGSNQLGRGIAGDESEQGCSVPGVLIQPVQNTVFNQNRSLPLTLSRSLQNPDRVQQQAVVHWLRELLLPSDR